MREPRLVRRRVSGDTPTVNWDGVKEVMVRHVPGLENVSAEEECWDERSRLRRNRKTVRSGRIASWRTVYTDAVAQMGICEDLPAIGDCQ